jgi:hypothetical protein
MPTDTQKQALLDAVGQIRSAEQVLIQACRASADPATLTKINTEYSQLDSFLSQMLHAQATADDDDFEAVVTALQQQVATLQVQENQMQAIVGDVAKAAQIAGYIAQALTYVAKL